MDGSIRHLPLDLAQMQPGSIRLHSDATGLRQHWHMIAKTHLLLVQGWPVLILRSAVSKTTNHSSAAKSWSTGFV